MTTTLTIADVAGLDQHGTAVRRKLAGIADRRGWSADGMAAAIAHESGWNPAAVNKGSGASGLIQITPRTAIGLGTTVKQIRRMGAEAQLDLAERYWRAASAGRPIGPRDWLVLGLGTGHVDGGYRASLPDATVLYRAGTPGARGNPGMQEPDGSLTVGGARRDLDRMLFGKGRLPIVAQLDPLRGDAGRVVAAAAGAELLVWAGLGVLLLVKLGKRRRK